MKLDTFLIEKLDVVMIKAQKRYGVNLAILNFKFMLFTFLFLIGGDFIRGTYSNGIVDLIIWSPQVGLRFFQMKKSYLYYENQRLTDNLNAKVLRDRENFPFMRIGIIILCVTVFIPILIVRLIPPYESDLLGWVAVCLAFLAYPFVWYLDTSTYVGPGEFAKEKKEVLSGDLAGEKI